MHFVVTLESPDNVLAMTVCADRKRQLLTLSYCLKGKAITDRQVLMDVDINRVKSVLGDVESSRSSSIRLFQLLLQISPYSPLSSSVLCACVWLLYEHGYLRVSGDHV